MWISVKSKIVLATNLQISFVLTCVRVALGAGLTVIDPRDQPEYGSSLPAMPDLRGKNLAPRGASGDEIKRPFLFELHVQESQSAFGRWPRQFGRSAPANQKAA